jgi:hypothetical protein
VPEPIFVAIPLNSQYAIIDTRKQAVFLNVNDNEKAQFLVKILNKHFAETELKKKLGKYIQH